MSRTYWRSRATSARSRLRYGWERRNFTTISGHLVLGSRPAWTCLEKARAFCGDWRTGRRSRSDRSRWGRKSESRRFSSLAPSLRLPTEECFTSRMSLRSCAAGKTGSAQKIDPATGRYSATQLIASFTGFAPINNPAVTILVSLDSPVGEHEGGQVAAPVFRRIAEQVLPHLDVPRDV